jgi:hypothetical protein
MAALGMEYNWDPDSKFVRAALADKYMRFNYDVKVLKGGWRPIERSGGNDRWENRWAVATETSAAELLESVNNSIAMNKTYGPALVKWTRTEDAAKDSTQSRWRFTDEKGANWNGVVKVDPVTGGRNQFILIVRIARANSSRL